MLSVEGAVLGKFPGDLYPFISPLVSSNEGNSKNRKSNKGIEKGDFFRLGRNLIYQAIQGINPLSAVIRYTLVTAQVDRL